MKRRGRTKKRNKYNQRFWFFIIISIVLVFLYFFTTKFQDFFDLYRRGPTSTLIVVEPEPGIAREAKHPQAESKKYQVYSLLRAKDISHARENAPITLSPPQEVPVFQPQAQACPQKAQIDTTTSQDGDCTERALGASKARPTANASGASACPQGGRIEQALPPTRPSLLPANKTLIRDEKVSVRGRNPNSGHNPNKSRVALGRRDFEVSNERAIFKARDCTKGQTSEQGLRQQETSRDEEPMRPKALDDPREKNLKKIQNNNASGAQGKNGFIKKNCEILQKSQSEKISGEGANPEDGLQSIPGNRGGSGGIQGGEDLRHNHLALEKNARSQDTQAHRDTGSQQGRPKGGLKLSKIQHKGGEDKISKKKPSRLDEFFQALG